MRDYNIVCHSDAGTRKDSCSRAAWYVEAIPRGDGEASRLVLAKGGRYIYPPISFFLAETIALDEAINAVYNIVGESSDISCKLMRSGI